MPAKLFNMPAKARILWISGEAAANPLSEALRPFVIEFASSGRQALGRLQGSRFAALLASFPLPDCSPAELLDTVRRSDARVAVMIHDPDGTMDDAVRLGRLGADQFFTGALEGADVCRRFQAVAVSSRIAQEEAPSWKQFLVGESRAMQEVDQLVALVASRRCTVLITGETGTGKEMLARAIHLASPRAAHPMIAVNCSALPENLLEAELFGHVKGAFTGAVNQRVGRFEQAHGSTLFLDEIGEMPLELQAKLLRVLQEREFQRLGSSETLRVDVRVIAASNVDLVERVRQGLFRQDLYYRLNVVPVEMPPLRARLCDIPELAAHFMEKICRLENIPPKQIATDTLDRMAAHSWPGNVRQLENAVEMAIALSGARRVLSPADFRLPQAVFAGVPAPLGPPSIPVPDDGIDFEQIVSRFERSILEQALQKTGGNKKMAAEMLRLKRTTLSAKLRSLEAAG